MRAISVLLVWAVISSSIAQEITTDSLNEKSNIIDPKPSVRLDPYIRKALLKALTELEESENSTVEYETTGDDTLSYSTNTELLKTGDEIKEVQPTESTTDQVRIHSFIVNGQSAFANATQLSPTFIDNNISILSTTTGNVENQVSATLPTHSTFNEIFQSKESSNSQQVRSIHTSINSKNLINSIKEVPVRNKTTTTTTTTTTTPKPTHNTDGENIEEVNKQDVQVFQAPLVAAFTVHQDAQGLPKKIVPIYQNRNQVKSTNSNLPGSNTFVQESFIQNNPKQSLDQSQNFNLNKGPHSDIINQQLALQKQLEDKQRILEEQLRFLQIQQRQQEELLRKQQFLLQQKEAQRQQLLLLEQDRLKRQQVGEQQRLQNNPGINNFPIPNLQNKFQNSNPKDNNGNRHSNSQVSIQSSVSLDHPNLIANHQQLPNREAVDFLLHLRNQQSEQFPLQENHLPQGISNFLHPSTAQVFHQGPNFNSLASSNDQFRNKQGNRIFRQEIGVGNLGINNQHFNRFNTFPPTNSNRFFTFNRPFGNNPDNNFELKQLLAQSGISGRSNEDLNIVSKVLSLNHGIPINNILSNRLPFDSRRQVRTSL